VSCPVTVLAPGESTTCTATYALTQADVDAGHVANTATASGTQPVTPANPTPTPVTATDATDTPLTATPVITLDKQAGTPTGATAGSTIDYSFVVTNTGNVTLDPIGVDDPKVGAVTCPVTVLAPGESTTCTATYTLTQADVDAGEVVNVATATGTDPTGADVTATDSTTTPIAAAPVITLDKQAGVPTGTAAGDTIDYSFVVTNTGNVTLDPISVDDPLVGTVSCPVTVLAPAESATCTATYTLTQADVDAGHVANTATATGTDPNGTDVTATDSTDTPITAGPAISLDKQAGVPTGNAAGDTIDYSFVVTNTGNVTLDPVSVDDPKVGAVTCPVTVLAPGVSTTCTATYTLTQGDVDAGHVANTATATGTDPAGTDATATDSTDTPITAGPAITLDKQAGVPTGTAAGDTIDYSFVVTNTGNVTLDPISVDDPTVGTVTCPVTTLAPGESTTCTAMYTLTQADVDAGEVVNVATATGTDPTGTDVTATDTTTTPIAPAPVVTLDKQAGVPTGANAGDTIGFSFLVTNTGNVTLDPVSVDDPLVGAVTCPVTVLAPGASMTCTASYTLTQADVDAGQVVNNATATGTDPNGTDVTAQDTTTTLIDPTPAITLDKHAGEVIDGDGNGVDEGDTIDYTFLVSNTGNVTLDPVNVDDPTTGPVVCPVTVLAPGESTTCTATYTLTQADVDAGTVHNEATASGTDPNGTDVVATDVVDTSLTPAPSILLEKVADTAGPVGVGDLITFSFTVTNTGNVTLTNVRVIDAMVGPVTCVRTTLAPGASTTCSAAPYTVTVKDVRRGSIVNQATARGNGGGGAEVSSQDVVQVSTSAPPKPAIRLVKKAGTAGPVKAGQEITYTFTVTNIGNVTLTNVKVSDPMVGVVVCPKTTLKPGKSMTCEAKHAYTVTKSDVQHGDLVNHAKTTGKYCPPTGRACTTVADRDALSIPTQPSGGLPNTGSAIRPQLILLALGLLLAGGFLLFAGRRRRA
jgi:large repetitive protein